MPDARKSQGFHHKVWRAVKFQGSPTAGLCKYLLSSEFKNAAVEPVEAGAIAALHGHRSAIAPARQKPTAFLLPRKLTAQKLFIIASL